MEISVANDKHFTRIRGDKTYELSNHLGNVLATVTDRKLGVSFTNSNTFAQYYQAEVSSATDYFPFGMPMPERNLKSDKVRYGFNGKEKDPEGMGGGGTTYDYGFRIYNPQIAKFLSVDPLTKDYPWYTPYQFAGNKPIWAIDLDGLEEFFVTQVFYKNKSIITIIREVDPIQQVQQDVNGKIQNIDKGFIYKRVDINNIDEYKKFIQETLPAYNNQLSNEQGARIQGEIFRSSNVTYNQSNIINDPITDYVSPFAFRIFEAGRSKIEGTASMQHWEHISVDINFDFQKGSLSKDNNVKEINETYEVLYQTMKSFGNLTLRIYGRTDVRNNNGSYDNDLLSEERATSVKTDFLNYIQHNHSLDYNNFSKRVIAEGKGSKTAVEKNPNSKNESQFKKDRQTWFQVK